MQHKTLENDRWAEMSDALESSDKFFMPFGMAAARRRQKTGAATE